MIGQSHRQTGRKDSLSLLATAFASSVENRKAVADKDNEAALISAKAALAHAEAKLIKAKNEERSLEHDRERLRLEERRLVAAEKKDEAMVQLLQSLLHRHS